MRDMNVGPIVFKREKKKKYPQRKNTSGTLKRQEQINSGSVDHTNPNLTAFIVKPLHFLN